MFIKICGVCDPKIARFAALAGADFIGCVLTKGYSRSVTLQQADQIAQAAYAAGAKPVAVFVGASKEEIEEVCTLLDIEYVQAYQLNHDLDLKFSRFYVNSTTCSLREEKDFLLMETDHPGSGEKIDLSTFIPPAKKPWFIAGGLTPENVREMILCLKPDGVDVSSGVEKNGIKDEIRIRTFIEQARLS